jgi:hypothetical protein
MATAKKKTRIEAKCAVWLARHPGAVVTPAAITTSVLELGTVTTGGIAAGIVTAGLGWYRAHPESFSNHAAPRLRSFRRRWSRCTGPGPPADGHPGCGGRSTRRTVHDRDGVGPGETPRRRP